MSTLPRRTLLVVWGRATLIMLLVFGVQGCNPILRVNEDPTGISEQQLARQKTLESGFDVHPNLSGSGQLIEGVVIPREIGPKAVRVSPEQEKVENHLLELYEQAALQAPAIKQDLFHEIEELEFRNGDIPALVWWLDREALAYPDATVAIREKKRALRDDVRRD